MTTVQISVVNFPNRKMKLWTVCYTFRNSKKVADIYLRVVKKFFFKSLQLFFR